MNQKLLYALMHKINQMAAQPELIDQRVVRRCIWLLEVLLRKHFATFSGNGYDMEADHWTRSYEQFRDCLACIRTLTQDCKYPVMELNQAKCELAAGYANWQAALGVARDFMIWLA